jgi:thymidylate synthase
MNNFEKKYKGLLKNIIKNGSNNSTRTGVNTLKLFNLSININLKDGFPIITGKKIFYKKALAEFYWIFEGRTDLKFLNDHDVNWWNSFADKNGDLGKIYGYQARKFNGGFDQIDYCIKQINENQRRAVISFWNPCDLKNQSLPCCFTEFIFVRDNKKLNMVANFRSSDFFLGLPYDIIVSSLFLIKIANNCGLEPSLIGFNLADAHIYVNQINSVKKYINNPIYPLPHLDSGFNLIDYKSCELIKTKLNN